MKASNNLLKYHLKSFSPLGLAKPLGFTLRWASHGVPKNATNTQRAREMNVARLDQSKVCAQVLCLSPTVHVNDLFYRPASITSVFSTMLNDAKRFSFHEQNFNVTD